MKKHSTGTLSRREALAAMGAIALSTRLASATNAVAGDAFKGIALQLYTLRVPAKDDLAGTLKKVRDMGWEYVQWSGMPDLPAQGIRDALDAAGLKAVSAHIGIEGFETDFEGQVAFWKTVGNTDVAPGGMMGDCKDSLEAWKRGAARLDAVGAKLREVGMRLSYHNHDWELGKFDGDDRAKLDILMAETTPGNLCAELDLAWVKAGGAEPAELIRKNKGRCPMIHAKDLVKSKSLLSRGVRFMPLGQGILDWPDIFAAGKESGVEWYIYEQDNADEKDIFQCAKESYDFLKKSLMA
ncbi:MAG TPA: sugar phosphate isomerase/epimerase [Candidatus Hydrogenedentes bacterium]|nr:sugar phosphate isomerase/epimerase [Candidatus Hydrogenedentota bacterium]